MPAGIQPSASEPSAPDDDFDALPSLEEVFPENPTEPLPDTPMDPVAVAADAVVSAALAGDPAIMARGAAEGAVTVLVVPARWERSLSASWRRLVLGEQVERGDPDDDDIYSRNMRHRKQEALGPLGVFAESDRDRDRVLGGQRVTGEARAALLARRGILCTVADIAAAPGLVVASADVHLTLPPPSADAIRAAAEAMGSGSAPEVDGDVAAEVLPDHLLAAARPEQTAADYVDRLMRLVSLMRTPADAAAVVDAPRWTLDTLPLPKEIHDWGRQLAADLRAYGEGRLSWADVDRGALLSGPSGCGKTTFAGALAATCGVPLLLASYTIWESGEDGKSNYTYLIKNMRMTFANAKAQAPCIVFIDEIDSFMTRGNAGHNQSWFTPIINALLAEIDGSRGREGVVVIGATNYPQGVDSALRRSGRLDRELRVRLPDAPTLARIFRAHLDGLGDADLSAASVAATGASGADCERWCREARRTARAAGRAVTAADLLAEIRGVRVARNPAVAKRVACHEAGHAVVGLLLRPGTMQMVSVRGGVLGAGTGGGVLWATDPEGCTEHEIGTTLQRILAGRAAEQVVLGDIGGGCGGPPDSDLGQATAIAASAELAWGLGERLTWRGDPTPETLAETLARNPDVAVRVERRLADAYAAACGLLRANRPAIDAMMRALLERETLSGDDAEAIIRAARNAAQPKPAVQDTADAWEPGGVA